MFDRLKEVEQEPAHCGRNEAPASNASGVAKVIHSVAAIMKFIAGIWIVIIVASTIPIIIIIAARAAIIAIVIVGAIGCYRSAKGETNNPRTEREASVIVVTVPAVAVTPG